MKTWGSKTRADIAKTVWLVWLAFVRVGSRLTCAICGLIDPSQKENIRSAAKHVPNEKVEWIDQE